MSINDHLHLIRVGDENQRWVALADVLEQFALAKGIDLTLDQESQEDEEPEPEKPPEPKRVNVTTRELLERRKLGLFRFEHFARHFVSGVIVFCMGVAADIYITRYYETVRPHHVSWINGENEDGFTFAAKQIPSPGKMVRFGLADTGHAVWSTVPQQQPPPRP